MCWESDSPVLGRRRSLKVEEWPEESGSTNDNHKNINTCLVGCYSGGFFIFFSVRDRCTYSVHVDEEEKVRRIVFTEDDYGDGEDDETDPINSNNNRITDVGSLRKEVNRKRPRRLI